MVARNELYGVSVERYEADGLGTNQASGTARKGNGQGAANVERCKHRVKTTVQIFLLVQDRISISGECCIKNGAKVFFFRASIHGHRPERCPGACRRVGSERSPGLLLEQPSYQ